MLRLFRYFAALLPSLASAHGGQPQVTDLIFPPAFPTEAWALTDNQGVFAVGPGTTRWLCEDAIEPGAGVRAVATLDARRWIVSTESGLWTTDDGGCTFAAMGGALAGHRARWLSVHPDVPDEVVVATDTLGRPNDVFRSTDGGSSFTPAGLAVAGQFTSLHRAPADPRRLYAVSEVSVERSDDGGRTFQPFKAGPAELAATPLEFVLLGTSPVDADVLMAVVERFDALVVRSEDGGRSWEQIVEVPDFPLHLVFDATGRRALLNGLFVGFLRSEDGGRTFAAAPRTVDRLGCLGRTGGRLWGCTQVFFGGPFVVGHSDDFGERWRTDLASYVDTDRQICPAGSPGRDCCQHLCPGVPPGGICADQTAAPGPTCGGPADAGVDADVDAAGVDAEVGDAGGTDAGVADAGVADAEAEDARVVDGGPPKDGGPALDAAAEPGPEAPRGGGGCVALPGL